MDITKKSIIIGRLSLIFIWSCKKKEEPAPTPTPTPTVVTPYFNAIISASGNSCWDGLTTNRDTTFSWILDTTGYNVKKYFNGNSYFITAQCKNIPFKFELFFPRTVTTGNYTLNPTNNNGFSISSEAGGSYYNIRNYDYGKIQITHIDTNSHLTGTFEYKAEAFIQYLQAQVACADSNLIYTATGSFLVKF